MPYRVLRCAQAAGSHVFVLGTDRARGLATSRYCQEFYRTGQLIDGSFASQLAEEINRHVKRLNIDLVLAGDAPSTRSLIAVRHLIDARCFPMPNLDQFDLLNDKWRFINLCNSLEIKCPKTQLFSSKAELERELDAGTIEFPLIAKPLSMDSGIGCVTVQRETAREDLSSIFYHPVLTQEFIAGEDIGASVFCREGEIQAFIAHRYYRATYSTFFADSIYNDIAKLMRAIKAEGVFNFDMRLTPDGQVFYLECNPRFFFKIAMSMLAGINFVSFGLPGHNNCGPQLLSYPVAVQFPKAMLAALLTPWKLGKNYWMILRFLFSDPIPYFREELGLENRDPGGRTPNQN